MKPGVKLPAGVVSEINLKTQPEPPLSAPRPAQATSLHPQLRALSGFGAPMVQCSLQSTLCESCLGASIHEPEDFSSKVLEIGLWTPVQREAGGGGQEGRGSGPHSFSGSVASVS